MKSVIELDAWQVTTRINRAGNLTLEISLNDEPHAELILQEGGVIDVGARVSPWPLGDKGWNMPGAPTGFRKFRFDPSEKTHEQDTAE